MQDIKRRIKSVDSTKQITKAMELVSSAKLRRARQRVEENRPYFEKIEEAIQGILPHTKELQNPYIDQREVKKTGYIVITGDRGLCGGYNTNAIKKALNHMEDREASVIAIGQKGVTFFRKRGYDLDGEFVSISEKPMFSDAKSIGKLAMELYKNEMIDEVNLVYTEFVSTITHKPKLIKLLPLDQKEIPEEIQEDRDEVMTYEPSPEEVLSYLIPKYVESMIYGALIEASASEQGARRVAMESATDNAEEMIDDLNLKYNRARQASITQEISEIVGGAEAQN
ncbi:ATP synthase F1 subunit gamma [Isachenkonia alkalipeptolytica]|uniref:ATP synthase gamma chain n=2 Tax=Isachenkonia alkalipeptolytica TaxID=2565777 RepID=A0AA43XL89_9CLOT|nr:ATP synthase F1 subunit gamma [Isachenkonia alkalipeptolytica]